MRLGSVPSSFSTTMLMASRGISLRWAITSSDELIHDPSPAAMRSVDEKVDPPPPNWGDTSVEISEPVDSWMMRVRPWPTGVLMIRLMAIS